MIDKVSLKIKLDELNEAKLVKGKVLVVIVLIRMIDKKKCVKK